MQAEALEDLIRQHGEAARSYEHDAVQIGETYMIQNFGFDVSMQTALDELLEHRRLENYGLVDVRVFAIPEGFTLFPGKEITEAEEEEYAAIDDLVQLCQELYPDDYPYYSLPEWWTEADVRKASQIMDALDFAIHMQRAFRLKEEEEETLKTWLGAIQSQIGDEITRYDLEDNNNENCAFYPIIFVGDRCLILVAWRVAL
ncbi:hypothetical protein DO97_21565 [Neosynechococcus sphagnicola sy1]|uniref:Uncharacterized protein n=2 Tax=Neosynechococcus TaxID=1501143 RepID=A0A098TFP6_9CYAN|nr:hypothetical protein DO97_21565 [Neosynechococcus sphagnicola sy1]